MLVTQSGLPVVPQCHIKERNTEFLLEVIEPSASLDLSSLLPVPHVFCLCHMRLNLFLLTYCPVNPFFSVLVYVSLIVCLLYELCVSSSVGAACVCV